MQIVKIPNEVLTTSSKPIPLRASSAEAAAKAEQGFAGQVDKKVLDFIEEMKKTLIGTKNPKGVGLAAPQVGRGVRIFITKPLEDGPMHVFINPEIISTSLDKTKGVPRREKKFEGCLSIPNIWGIVHRHKSIKLSFIDERGIAHTQTFKGFHATIIQHETDHINGILFTQRVLEQKNKLFKITGKDEEDNDVFEEIEI